MARERERAARRMGPLLAHCRLTSGRCLARAGNRQMALDAIEAALAAYRAMGMAYWVARAEVARGEADDLHLR